MDWIALIRKRPGMFVGDLGYGGTKTLIGGVVDCLLSCSLSEAQLVLNFKPDHFIALEAKGIDGNLSKELITRFDQELDWEKDAFKILLALTEVITIELCANNETITLKGKKGVYELDTTVYEAGATCLSMLFKIDMEIFKNTTIHYEAMNLYLRKYAFLNPGYRITTIDSSTAEQQINIFRYPKGVAHELDLVTESINYNYTLLRMDLMTQIRNYAYQISFSFQKYYGINYWLAFANSTALIYGGSLEDGILDGIAKAFREMALLKNMKVSVSAKKIKKDLLLIAAIKGDNLAFEGSTREKLGMVQVRSDIKEYMHKTLMTSFESNETVFVEILKRFSN